MQSILERPSGEVAELLWGLTANPFLSGSVGLNPILVASILSIFYFRTEGITSKIECCHPGLNWGPSAC